MHIRPRIIFDHELVLILAGRGRIVFGRRQVPFHEHQLLFLRPFVPHEIYSDPSVGSDHVAVHFDFVPGVPPFSSAPYRRRPYEVQFTHGATIQPMVTLSAGHVVERCLLEVVEAHGRSAPWSGLESATALQRALVTLMKLAGVQAADDAPDRRNRQKLQRAITLMQQRLDRPLTASDLASAAGLSLSHFNRLFAQWTGQSPMDYLRHLRVEKARALLADVDLTIKQVAGRAGFADQYHFSKVFHQIDGLPPSAFREALLASKLVS